MATNNKTVMGISQNTNYNNLLNNNWYLYSERFFQEYENAKKLGFNGTYEEYIELRDFT